MARQALTILAVVIAFGILVPIYKGFGFLDARIIAAYGVLAVLFVAPASADLATRAAATGAILARIGIIVAWGWGLTVLILGTAIVTLNVMARRGGFTAPPFEFLASVLVFSLTASIAVSFLGATLARRFSAAQVKTILRVAFLVILLGLAFGSRFLPESVTLELLDRLGTRRALTHLAWQTSIVFGVVAVLLLLLLIKTAPAAALATAGKPSATIPMAENPDQGGR
jgi:hypothetical protein